MKTRRVKKQSFTLMEIIAVLIIIGIMAAVAIPRFLNLADDAREAAGQAGINEAKATLSVAYAKAYLALDGASNPDSDAILDNAGTSHGGNLDFGEINVTFTRSGTETIILSADEGIEVNDTWTRPSLTP